MESVQVKRPLFLQKLESKSPVKLSSVSVSSSNQIAFFNANAGSKCEEALTLPFAYVEAKPVTVQAVLSDAVVGNFTVEGEVKWKDEKKEVLVGAMRIPRVVRDAILADNTGNVAISIWGNLIEEIPEGVPISITSVICQYYNGTKLCTTGDSTFVESEKVFERSAEEVKEGRGGGGGGGESPDCAAVGVP